MTSYDRCSQFYEHVPVLLFPSGSILPREHLVFSCHEGREGHFLTHDSRCDLYPSNYTCLFYDGETLGGRCDFTPKECASSCVVPILATFNNLILLMLRLLRLPHAQHCNINDS